MNEERVSQLQVEETKLMDQVRALRQPYLTDEGVRAMPAEVETEQTELLTRAEGAAAAVDEAREQLRSAQTTQAANDRFTALEGRLREPQYPAPVPGSQPPMQQRAKQEEAKSLEDFSKGFDENGFRWDGPLTPEERARYRRNWVSKADLRTMRKQDRSGLENKDLIRAFIDYSNPDIGRAAFQSKEGREMLRAFQMDLDTTGGYLRPPDAMSADVIQGVDDMVYIRQVANVIPVRIGQEYVGRVRHTRQDDATWTTEHQQIIEDETVDYGVYTWRPHRLTKLLLVSRDLLQMGSDIFMQEFSSEAMYAFDVTQEKAFLTGTGAGQPQGVLVNGPDGGPIGSDRVSSVGNTNTAMTYDGIVTAEFELKAQHRRMAKWMFHRHGVRNLYTIKNDEGTPYFRNKMAEGESDSMGGRMVMESEYMPNTFTTGLTVGILANWYHYRIVESKTFEVQVLDQPWARVNQVGYLFRWYLDAKPELSEAFIRLALT